MYLLKEKSKTYHAWDGNNTFCKMWLTGGMAQNGKYWKFTQDIGDRKLCQMCETNLIKFNRKNLLVNKTT